jgi:hypothetical protein
LCTRETLDPAGLQVLHLSNRCGPPLLVLQPHRTCFPCAFVIKP